MGSQNYINHIALVLDASSSMRGRANDLIKVADDQIAHLARRSQELDQETRVSVYTFASQVECVVFDKDVLRLPSIKSLYRANGMTALIDATLKSQDDLGKTAQMYGDHAFLTYVLTDGQENQSRNRPDTLRVRLSHEPENWTVAVLVPDQRGVFDAKSIGFPADNIAVWDPDAKNGVFEAGDVIRRATEQFMVNRSSGIRGTRSLFSTGADAVNQQTIRAAGLAALAKNSYVLLPVDTQDQIRPFVERHGRVYKIGSAFYQLNKTETIQRQKEIAVVEKGSGKVYTGSSARQMIGLPDVNTRVKPDYNPDFDVFVQSTSVNRNLVAGTKLLVLT